MKKTIYGLFAAALLVTGLVFANDYYDHSGIPATGSPGSSAQMRAEFASIETGFAKLPSLSGNGNKAIVVNSGGTALTVSTGGLALGGNFTISGAFATTLTVTNTTTVTLPVTGTLATLAGAETLTNKTFAIGSNTFSGSTAQFNTALSDGDFATLAGSETLTTKTFALGSNTLSGTTAQFNTALTDGNFATLDGVETLTNKDITGDFTGGFSGSVSVPTTLGQLASSTQLIRSITGLDYGISGGDVTNDIFVQPGGAADLSSGYWINLSSALTKRIDAGWAVGDAQGGLDTGAVGNNDYFIWLIARSDTGVVDVLFSLSAVSPTMPANYDQGRLIGWFKRSAGANLYFICRETEGGGIDFRWATPILSVNIAATLTTTQRSDQLAIPNGFEVDARIIAMMTDASVAQAILQSSEELDAPPSTSASPGFNLSNQVAGGTGSAELTIRTNGFLHSRASVATVDNYRVVTKGFRWARREF